jgi:hypothetical protein
VFAARNLKLLSSLGRRLLKEKAAMQRYYGSDS